MKDPYAVLLQKEREMQRVRSEVEALRSIVPLLADEAPTGTASLANSSPDERNRWPLQMK
jgi:hypothetical protein